MGNTNPWAATNCRATLLSLDKPQATSFKQQATSVKRQAATFRALPGLSCHGILSSNKSNDALAPVSMRDLLIPLVDRPSHKSDSVRPARGSFSFPEIKAASFKRQAVQGASDKLQAPSGKRQASSRKLQALVSGSQYKVSRS
jgi:hypothetical protein